MVKQSIYGSINCANPYFLTKKMENMINHWANQSQTALYFYQIRSITNCWNNLIYKTKQSIIALYFIKKDRKYEQSMIAHLTTNVKQSVFKQSIVGETQP